MHAIDEAERRRREVGKRIAELREGKKLTQPQLADLAGIKQSSLWAIENGQTVEVTARTLIGLGRALETTIEYLWWGKGTEAEAELVSIFRKLKDGGQMAVLQSARTALMVEEAAALRNPLPPQTRVLRATTKSVKAHAKRR